MKKFKHSKKSGLSLILVLSLVTSLIMVPVTGLAEEIPLVEDFNAVDFQGKYSGEINEYTLAGNSSLFKEIRHQIGDGNGYGFKYEGCTDVLGMLKVVSKSDDETLFTHGYLPGSGMYVNDGKLTVTKTTIQSTAEATADDGSKYKRYMHDYHYFLLRNAIKSGVYSFKFKFSSGQELPNYHSNLITFTGISSKIGWYANKLVYAEGNDWQSDQIIDPIVPNQEYELEIIFDLNKKVSTIYVDGVSKLTQSLTLKDTGWTNILITAFSSTLNNGKYGTGWKIPDGVTWSFTFDDMALTELNVPEAHLNITDDEATAVNETQRVPVDTVPTLTFDSAIAKADTPKILFYKDGELVAEPDYKLSEDGLTLTIGEKLSNSSTYSIEVPDTISTAKRITLAPVKYTFTTEHVVADVVVTDAVASDMSTLKGGSEFTASATFTNNESKARTFTFWLGIYKDGTMKDLDIKTITLDANGGTASPELKVVLPGSADDPTALDGVTYKTFVWDSLDTLVPLFPYES